MQVVSRDRARATEVGRTQLRDALTIFGIAACIGLGLFAVMRLNVEAARQCIAEGGTPTSGAFLGMICANKATP